MAVQQTFNINLRTNKIFISSKNQLIVSVINLTNELAEIKVNTMYHILCNGEEIDINIITPNNALHSAVAFIFCNDFKHFESCTYKSGPSVKSSVKSLQIPIFKLKR